MNFWMISNLWHIKDLDFDTNKPKYIIHVYPQKSENYNSELQAQMCQNKIKFYIVQ
jgi:hypothetical protein